MNKKKSLELTVIRSNLVSMIIKDMRKIDEDNRHIASDDMFSIFCSSLSVSMGFVFDYYEDFDPEWALDIFFKETKDIRAALVAMRSTKKNTEEMLSTKNKDDIENNIQ